MAKGRSMQFSRYNLLHCLGVMEKSQNGFENIIQKRFLIGFLTEIQKRHTVQMSIGLKSDLSKRSRTSRTLYLYAKNP